MGQLFQFIESGDADKFEQEIHSKKSEIILNFLFKEN